MNKAAFLTAFLMTITAFAGGSFPTGPNAQLTPGETCTTPSAHRYPEQIAYCERSVDTQLKKDIIKTYDQNLGYRIQSMERSQFKIDHYIPLCMGGANDKENLWPQHKTVYEITDPLEQEACEKMAQGKLLQAKAIELIKQAKNNLDQVGKIRAYVNAL